MLNDKVAVVTGGSSGIGAAIALKYAKEGAQVIIVGRNKARLEEVKKQNQNISYIVGDITSSDVIKSIVEGIETKHHGKLDILVNNAGITKDMLLMRMKKEDFESVIGVNLVGTFNITKNVIPYMMKNRSGRIINVTSVVVIVFAWFDALPDVASNSVVDDV